MNKHLYKKLKNDQSINKLRVCSITRESIDYQMHVLLYRLRKNNNINDVTMKEKIDNNKIDIIK